MLECAHAGTRLLCGNHLLAKSIAGCSPKMVPLGFKHLYTTLPLRTGSHHPNQSEILKKEKTARPLMPPHICVES